MQLSNILYYIIMSQKHNNKGKAQSSIRKKANRLEWILGCSKYYQET